VCPFCAVPTRIVVGAIAVATTLLAGCAREGDQASGVSSAASASASASASVKPRNADDSRTQAAVYGGPPVPSASSSAGK
jgi:outer membrane murein-binding lipoprotein Lpp